MTGYISTEFVFWCGRCINWTRFTSQGTRPKTKAFARKKGWTLTKLEGWICPSCNKGETKPEHEL